MSKEQQSWTEEEKKAWKIVRKQWLLVGLAGVILFNIICDIYTRFFEGVLPVFLSSFLPPLGPAFVILFVFAVIRSRFLNNKNYRDKMVEYYFRKDPKARNLENTIIWIAFGFLCGVMAILVIVSEKFH